MHHGIWSSTWLFVGASPLLHSMNLMDTYNLKDKKSATKFIFVFLSNVTTYHESHQALKKIYSGLDKKKCKKNKEKTLVE